MKNRKMSLTEIANMKGIFTNNNYTYYEYVNQLNGLEQLLGEAVC